MKQRRTNFKSILTIVFFMFSFSTFAQELPNPEVLAKQYLKDLCTLNEQDFVRKYMLTQADAEFFINEMITSYKKMNKTPYGEFSDSLEIRSKVHESVLRSYREFKEWQHDKQIDSSKIVYHSCAFELEKDHEIPFYKTGDTKIYFKVDTVNYAIDCDEFVFLKNKWIGGDIDGIISLDKSFEEIYDDYADESGYAVDTVAADSYYEENEYYESTEEVYEAQPLTKKQLKIQKKIDAYNRKIDALYIKQYE